MWKVDVDEWKGRGKAGDGWDVPAEPEEEEPPSAPQSDDESEGSEAEIGESGDEDASSGEDEGEDQPKRTPRKRARAAASTPRKRKRVKVEKESTRRRRAPHAKASSSHLPGTVPIEDLPADPYERALRLLHVGATPESLPCREEEFVDVLARLEEGIESGGGGCLCESYFWPC